MHFSQFILKCDKTRKTRVLRVLRVSIRVSRDTLFGKLGLEYEEGLFRKLACPASYLQPGNRRLASFVVRSGKDAQ